MLSEDYLKRIRAYQKVATDIRKDCSEASRSKDSLDKETVDTFDHLILLDERGWQPSSQEWAGYLSRLKDDPAIKTVGIAVGGAYGFTENDRGKASKLVSLSSLVFPNEIAWLLLTEQLYRGFSILAGANYHHE